MRRAVSASIARALARSRKCDRSDEMAMPVSGPPQTRRSASATRRGSASPTRIGRISNGAGQHRLQHHQMHFERMLAGEGPCVDRRRRGFREPEVEIARDFGFAERRRPGHGRMDREAAEGDAMRRADDDDAARRIGPPRPGAEGGRGDRAGIDDAGMRRDDDLRRDAAVRPGALAHLRRSACGGLGLRRIEEARDLRGMNVVGHRDPRPVGARPRRLNVGAGGRRARASHCNRRRAGSDIK